VPELASGFHLLYTQNFAESREKFADWESQHPDEPFGQVAVASQLPLRGVCNRQGVLSSDFLLNEKKFLNGIDGKTRSRAHEEFSGGHPTRPKTRPPAPGERPTGPGRAFRSRTLRRNGIECRIDSQKEHLEALKRLKEASVHARNCLRSSQTPTTRTLRWARPTTLSEAFREVSVSCSGSEVSTATKSSAWNSLETPLKRDDTCSRTPRFCWPWRLAGKNKIPWRRTVSRIERGISGECALRR